MTVEASRALEQKIDSIKDNRLFLVFIFSIIILCLFLNELGVSYLPFLSMKLNDAAAYISMTRAFCDSGHFISNLVYPCLIGTPYTRFYMPGYYMVLAAVYHLFGASIYTWILPSVLSYITSGTLIYAVGNKLYNKKVGIIAALVFILNPFVILLSLTAMSEMTIMLIVLSAYYVFIITPEKLKYYIFPLLISSLFLFKQQTILIAIPMLAFVFQESNDIHGKKYYWIFSVIITGLLLIILNRWQISEGMRPWPIVFQDLFSAKTTGNGVGLMSVFLHFNDLNYLMGYINNIGSNISKNSMQLKSYLRGYIVYGPAEKYYFSLILASIILSLVTCFKKSPLYYLPLATILMSVMVFCLCLSLYNGYLDTLNRVLLFTYPFIAILLSEALLNIADFLPMGGRLVGVLNKYDIVPISFLIFNLFYSLFFVMLLHRDLINFASEEIKREQFISTIQIDKSKLFVGPAEFCGGFIYKHYPTKYAFLPTDFDTLVLLKMKYHIGTLVFNNYSTSELTPADLTRAGFVLSQRTLVNGVDYFVYHNSKN